LIRRQQFGFAAYATIIPAWKRYVDWVVILPDKRMELR